MTLFLRTVGWYDDCNSMNQPMKGEGKSLDFITRRRYYGRQTTYSGRKSNTTTGDNFLLVHILGGVHTVAVLLRLNVL